MDVDKIIKVLTECKQCQHMTDGSGIPVCTNPNQECFEAHCAAINYIEAAEERRWERRWEMRWHDVALEPETRPDPERMLLLKVFGHPETRLGFYIPFKGRFYDDTNNILIHESGVVAWRYLEEATE